MTHTVVHHLEAVQVQQQDRDPVAVALRPREGMLEPIAKHGAVRKAGQRVEESLTLELLLETAPIRNVPRVEDEAGDRGVAGEVADDRMDCRIEPSACRSRN